MNIEYEEMQNKKVQFIKQLSDTLTIEKNNKNYSNIIFLCIGTDKIIGDCLGPLVGTRLKEIMDNKNIYNINIYGTLDENVCYTNIKEVLKDLNKNSQTNCIITIDAALSDEKNIGKIFVDNDKMILGEGLNKLKIEVGDVSIKAVVGKNYNKSRKNFKSLKQASLNDVISLSEIISDGIYETIKYI